LQLNVEAFRWNYRDQVYNFVGPVPGTTFVSNVFINIGRGYVQGLSADVVAKPWNGATLRGAIEYADSKYTDFQYDAVPGQRGPANTTCVVGAIHTNSAGVAVQTVDCSGRPFILASKWSGNASFEQEFGLQNGGAIRLNAGMTFNSSRFAQFEFLPSQLLPGAVVVDLSASYTSPSERWSVRLYVQNVTDIVTYSQAQALTGTSRASSPAGGPVVAGAIGAPRRFGASLGIKF
jgi:iron complex outermembrane receptor protein